MKGPHRCEVHLMHTNTIMVKTNESLKTLEMILEGVSVLPERMSFVAVFRTAGSSCVSESTGAPSSQKYLNTT